MSLIIQEKIEKMIYVIRGQKVMLDSDLANLYGVETKMLKRAVRRNIDRFPEDFMFELSNEGLINWRYQFGTSNKEKMGLRIPPFAFTEQGVAMLSSVLNSAQAVQINIAIMRIFMKLRSFFMFEKNMTDQMTQLKDGTNQMFRVVFERLDSIEENITPHLPSERKKIVRLGTTTKDSYLLISFIPPSTFSTLPDLKRAVNAFLKASLLIPNIW